VGTHKNKEHLVKIKDAVVNSQELSEEEKTNTLKHIDEWLVEDKAEGMFLEELVKLASGMRPLLVELGLL